MSPDDVEDRHLQQRWHASLGHVPLDAKISKKQYNNLLAELQDAIMLRHNALMAQKRRAIIVFEGWDAAGKGGAIKRLTSRWDPRGYKVWPIAAPDEHERARHYLYRFWKRLPRNGEIGIFDRSWYGRVMVERVEGFCNESEWRRSYDEINHFEQTLIDNGSRIIKFFLNVSPDEQAKRFKDRLETPHKRWKITQDDFRNRSKHEAYSQAIEEMLAQTSNADAPWIVIPAEQKRFARIAVLSAVLRWLDDFDLDLNPPLDQNLSKYINTV